MDMSTPFDQSETIREIEAIAEARPQDEVEPWNESENQSETAREEQLLRSQHAALQREIGLLHSQNNALRREINGRLDGAKEELGDGLTKPEIEGQGMENSGDVKVNMNEYEWSTFLYEWRRKFGDWGKRVLDVNSCQNQDRTKAGHLLIEIDRRRRALASCKAHILNLLKAAGNQE